VKESIREILGAHRDHHLAYETLEQMVDGTADDVTREIVASHVGMCANCAADLRDLTAFTTPRRSFVTRWIAAAAALIALIGGAAFLFLHAAPAKNEVRVPHRVVNKARAVASGYGRPDWDAAVHDAVARGTIDQPAILHELRPPADVLRGGDPSTEPARMKPAGVVIETATPKFAWAAKGGPYRVSVYHGRRCVAQSGELDETEWQIPKPLARGKTYKWEVEIGRGDAIAILPSPPSPPSLFYVCSEDEATELTNARTRFPNDHLLLGVLYARAGMQREAVDELQGDPTGGHDALADAVARW